MPDQPSGKLYYSISEVSKMTNLKQHVLRYWESEFPSLRPKKNRAGNRIYRPKDIKLILLIKHLLYNEKYTIEGARQKLKKSPDFVNHQLGLSMDEIKLRDLLYQVRKELEELLMMLE